MPDDAHLVEVPDAPLGRADATRRYALRLADQTVCFPGLARPEVRELAPRLTALSANEIERAAVAVELPVALSDGAGPHLLCHDGALALALGEHPLLPGRRVAMAEPTPNHRIGVVAPDGQGPLWWWECDAVVTPARRVDALDQLAAAGTSVALERWRDGLAEGDR